MRLGLATAGGDCPGLNPLIRAVVRRARAGGHEVFGFESGWEGMVEGRGRPLDVADVRGILRLGGTILGSSRYDPYVHGAGAADVAAGLEAAGVDSVIVAGGDGTLATAHKLSEDGIAILGVPKTIDGDVPGTDAMIGYSTAVQIVTDTLDRLTTTAESHHRLLLVEVMGRHSGWIAAAAGIAGGADHILVPEYPFTIDEIVETVRMRRERGRKHTIVVVAEGVEMPGVGRVTHRESDAFGFERLGGVCDRLSAALEEAAGLEVRTTVLGYVQRGGNPNAEDRILGTRFGVAASDWAAAGRHGVMVAKRGAEIVPVPLAEVLGPKPVVPAEWLDIARTFYA